MQVQLQESEALAPGQRRCQRLDSDIKQIVLTGDHGERWVGRVTDESQGGIGLQFDQMVPLCEGQELELVLEGVRMLAQIRHLRQMEPEGCRVGVEWNAYCLSERARAATRPRHSTPPDEMTRGFINRVPGGVYMLWRHFESYDWTTMVILAERLSASAASCGIEVLTPLAQALRDRVATGLDEPSVRTVVHDFIRECVVSARLDKPSINGENAELPIPPRAGESPDGLRSGE